MAQGGLKVKTTRPASLKKGQRKNKIAKKPSGITKAKNKKKNEIKKTLEKALRQNIESTVRAKASDDGVRFSTSGTEPSKEGNKKKH